MKLTAIFLTGMLAASLVFAMAGCKNGDDEQKSEPTAVTTEANGTTTLKIQENAAGFVSSTFEKKTEFPGYTGTGYFDGGTSQKGSIVYTVSAAEAITNAKIAIHYLCTEVSRVRAAIVSVNGTVINADSPLAMTTDVKVKKDNCSSANWKDTVYLENISLKAGSNSIILTGAPDGSYTAAGGTSIKIDSKKNDTDAGNYCYLNYVDYLIVNGKGIDYGTDTTKYVSLSYASENTTAGSVESSVTSSTVAENSDVTFTATANSGWVFDCWSDGSKENPHKVTVTKNTIMFAHFIPTDYTASSDLVGYATITTDSGDGYTISGGAGASSENTITISSYAELVAKKDLLSSDEPKIITISGTISTKDNANPLLSEKYTIGSNSTVYGDTTNQGRLQNIEFIVEGENVIIRNMMFGEVISWDGYTKSGADDALSLNGATHVWVDHCEFQSHLTPQDLDGNEITSSSTGIAGSYYSTDEKWKKDFYDGLLDIKNGSTWITISNCYIHDHYKACLCASGDDGPDKNTTTGATDSDMRVTFYHNYWKNINARMPLFRYGTGHIYSCYFDAGSQSDSASCINVRAGSKLYIEGNNFANFTKTTGDSVTNGTYIIGFFFADTNKAYGNVSGSWTAKNNSTSNGSEGSVSKPPYEYTAPTSYPTFAPTDIGVGILTASDLQ
ncbi:MAG: hypothetical protein K6B73_08935 [Treponema sp.]|nr:hypothetical protein [Treponema sp.]